MFEINKVGMKIKRSYLKLHQNEIRSIGQNALKRILYLQQIRITKQNHHARRYYYRFTRINKKSV